MLYWEAQFTFYFTRFFNSHAIALVLHEEKMKRKNCTFSNTNNLESDRILSTEWKMKRKHDSV